MELEVPTLSADSLIQNGTAMSAAGLAMKDIEPYTLRDMIFAFRCHFYLWTPRETLFKTMAEVPNMFVKVISYMPFLIVLELIGLLARGKQFPRWNHSLMSACTAILLFLPSSILGNIEFTWFRIIHENYRIVDLPWDSVAAWVACFFACDLGSYLWHRAAHEVNFVWAFHSVHHTSDEINIMAGYRLPTFNRQIAILFYLPMAFIFHPAMFYTHYQLNYISQLWVHTNIFEGAEWMGKFIITPQLHRVHHARNRYCIDKNYGAVLSIWDHLLGTFTPYREDIPLSFGLVSRIQTFDPISVQVSYLWSIIKRAASYDNWKDRVFCFIKGPGWEPGKPRLGIYEEIPEVYDDKPYDKQSPVWCYAYCTWSILMATLLFGISSQARLVLDSSKWLLIVLFLFWMVADVGYILEHKPWVMMSEVLRCAFYFLLESQIMPLMLLHPILWTAFRYTTVISLLICSFKMDMFCAKDSTKID